MQLKGYGARLAPAQTQPRAWPPMARPVSRAQFIGLLLVCFGLHAVLRRIITETAGIDDVDQVLRAQIWSWGYGPQPPLYTWLVKIFLGAFGSSVLPLLLLKESLVFSIYAFTYAGARRITRDPVRALLAVALLQANFSIAWEAHRELTHTVLVSAMSVFTIYCFLRLTPHRWTPYFWFGLAGGLGMLSKYNYLFLWVALWLSALSLRGLWPVIFNRKMLAAVLLTGLVCVPHFLWVFHHRALAFSSVHKLKMAPAGDWNLVEAGLLKWLVVILAHIGPMVAIVVLLFHRELKWSPTEGFSQAFLWRTLAALLLLVTVNIICFRVTAVRDRYVQPFFAWFPLLLVLGLPPSPPPRRTSFLLALGCVSAFVIALVAPGRVLLTEPLKRNEVLNTPFAKLAHDLAPAAAQADCIIAPNHTLAGNLRLWFPRKLVLDPEVGPLFAPGRRKSLLVWDSDSGQVPPDELLSFTRSFAGPAELGPITVFQERLKYHHRRVIRLAAALTQGGRSRLSLNWPWRRR